MEDGFLKLYKVKGYIMGIVYWGHYKPGIWEERAARLYGSSILEWVFQVGWGRCTIPYSWSTHQVKRAQRGSLYPLCEGEVLPNEVCCRGRVRPLHTWPAHPASSSPILTHLALVPQHMHSTLGLMASSYLSTPPSSGCICTCLLPSTYTSPPPSIFLHLCNPPTICQSEDTPAILLLL